MKRIVFIFMASVIFLAAATACAGSETVSVVLDGLPLSFDVPPVIIGGRTMLPFRHIAEALNIEVHWNAEEQAVTARGASTVVLTIGSHFAAVNDEIVPLDAAPVIIDGRTLIPLRFFGEALGCRVEWQEETRTVAITSAPRPLTVLGFYALGDSSTSSWTDLFGTPYPKSARGNTDVVSDLALGWYTLDTGGNLLTKSSRNAWQRPDGWQDVLAEAARYELFTEMVVHETNRQEWLATFLQNPQAVENAINQIVAEARLYGGVNLDLEGLGYLADLDQQKVVQELFTSFVRSLYPRLKAAGKTLTLTLHPPNSVYRGYNYAELGQLADRIVIMAYDYGSKPEPVDRVVQAVESAAKLVPPEKLLLGISAPSETAESIGTKVGIAKRYRLGGIALWRLGLVSPEMWREIRTMVQSRFQN